MGKVRASSGCKSSITESTLSTTMHSARRGYAIARQETLHRIAPRLHRSDLWRTELYTCISRADPIVLGPRLLRPCALRRTYQRASSPKDFCGFDDRLNTLSGLKVHSSQENLKARVTVKTTESWIHLDPVQLAGVLVVSCFKGG